MPIYEFQCPKCDKKYEEFVFLGELTAASPCCSIEGNRTDRFYSHRVQMGGFQRVDRAQIEKAQKHGDIDGGVPFGQVPGDEIYTDMLGKRPGDDGYRGPIP